MHIGQIASISCSQPLVHSYMHTEMLYAEPSYRCLELMSHFSVRFDAILRDVASTKLVSFLNLFSTMKHRQCSIQP